MGHPGAGVGSAGRRPFLRPCIGEFRDDFDALV